MADLKISELSALAGSNLVAADALAIVDDSASETKKITVSDLIANGVTVISDDTIPGAKILFGAGDIATAALADAAVTTAKVADDAITAAKLGNESTVDLVTTLPGAGAFTGQLAFDTDDNKLYVWDGSAWQSLKAAGSVNTVSGSTTGEINIVSSVSGDTVTLTATIDNTSSANQFLAGPTGAAGAVGYRVIDGSDLPVATSSAKGGVVVNGEGLRMDANTIEVNNDVTASSTHHVVTYDAKGLITGGRVLAASDLPIATASAVGGVIPSTGLTVDGSGNLTINNTVTADTYTKVTVAATGLVTAGSTLAASDLPNHSADLLTSGNIPLARIADNLVTGAKLADYASAKIGETNPTADYIGQLFFNPLTRDLSLWDGNVFQPIGISAGEIVFAGTYNATTNLVSSVTSDGTGAGFVVGQALPAASNTNKNFYVVVGVGGTGTSPAPAVSLAPPDFILSTGSEYRLIDVSETVTAQVASNVGFTPVGTIAANNVQTALAEVDTEKVAKSGDTMTGDLTLNDANVVFEGATENAFETTLTVVDPTADRTITLPNATGTVLTTGSTGAVSSAMIVDGTIVNADINASAEIAVSKLANGTARQLLQTASNGSDVEFTSNVDVPGTLDVTGAATLDSTLGVAGLISADGKVSFPLGSASAPSLLPGTDTNTGIFSPGADQLAVTTGGTQRVTVDASGNCGIGSSSPASKLDVKRTDAAGNYFYAGASSDNGIRGLQFSSSNNGVYLGAAHKIDATSSGGSIALAIGGTERLRIDSSGNVFIGGTTASSADIALNANGSITAAGALAITRTSSTQTVLAGFLSPSTDSTFKVTADGTVTTNSSVTAAGNITTPRILAIGPSANDKVWSGYLTNTTGAATSFINADGSATFAGVGTFSGDLRVQDGGNFRVRTAADSASDAILLQNNGSITAFGDATINSLTVGRGAGSVSSNTAIGQAALFSNTTGALNTANGYASLYYNTTGDNNTATGYQSLLSNTTGSHNTATGYRALHANTTGNRNTANGYGALYSNTTASDNVAVGYRTLYNNTTGSNNTGCGLEALNRNTTGNNNAANGFYALYSNTTGGQNTASGTNSLRQNTTGSSNTAAGYDCLRSNTTGSNNVASGADALRSNTTGTQNTAFGVNALLSNSTGSYNSATGFQSLKSNTTGNNNTANGYFALDSNTTGGDNTSVGKSALANNTTGNENVSTGYNSLLSNTTGGYNVAYGARALYSNTTANNNVAVGYFALYSNTTGHSNAALGSSALRTNTTGIHNTATGINALYTNNGSYNVAAGYGALQNNTTGNNNTANGYEALLSNTTGYSNTAIGFTALRSNTTGLYSTATGQEALRYNTTGGSNVANGWAALRNNSTGGNNVAVGREALRHNTTGIYNTAVGRDALDSNTTGSGNIGIGFVNSGGSYLPVFNPTTESDRLVLGHTSITNAYVKVAWTVTSDERDKMNFAPVPYGLDFVNQLKPTAYQFKVDRDTETPNGDVRYGFKAQDILALEGDNPVIIDTEDADHLKYKGEHLVPVLVNAVQELTAMVKELQNEVAALKSA